MRNESESRNIWLAGIALTVAFGAVGAKTLSMPETICVGSVSGEKCAQPSTSRQALSGVVKWNPGHYVRYVVRKELPNFEPIYRQPYISGVELFFRWKDLEPIKNKYDFALIDSALSKLQKRGKRLIILVLERDFSSKSCDNSMLPTYIVQEGLSQTKDVDKKGRGCVTRIWQSGAMDRYIALMSSIGARYDGHPNLEAVKTPETALTINQKTAPGYSHEAYVAQLKRLYKELRNAFPNTVLFAGMNFLGGGSNTKYLDELASYAASLGMGVSHPDTAPDRTLPVYVIEEKYKGEVPIGPDVQTASLDLNNPQHSEESIMKFAVTQLGATHISWNGHFSNKKGVKMNSGAYLSERVFPAVSANKGMINDKCPATLDCGTQ